MVSFCSSRRRRKAEGHQASPHGQESRTEPFKHLVQFAGRRAHNLHVCEHCGSVNAPVDAPLTKPESVGMDHASHERCTMHSGFHRCLRRKTVQGGLGRLNGAVFGRKTRPYTSVTLGPGTCEISHLGPYSRRRVQGSRVVWRNARRLLDPSVDHDGAESNTRTGAA
jgi:hypothetical protein